MVLRGVNFEKFNISSYRVRHYWLAIVRETGFSSCLCRVGMKTIELKTKGVPDLTSEESVRELRQGDFRQEGSISF